MRNILNLIKRNEGTSLIEIITVIIIVFSVMIFTGLFSPPKSPVTDTREGDIVDDGSKSKKNTLNLKDVQIQLSDTTPAPTSTTR